jgi:hypothetical protein
MLKSARRVLVLPSVSVEWVYSTVAVGGSLALLLQDRVHPAIIYLLQLFLTL